MCLVKRSLAHSVLSLVCGKRQTDSRRRRHISNVIAYTHVFGISPARTALQSATLHYRYLLDGWTDAICFYK